MDRWKSRGGKSQRREEQKREDQRRESLRRKKIQVRAKVGKSRSIVFLQWFVAPGSLKRRVRSHLARWEMKSCGAKPIPKSKCTKHHMFRWLLEVEMSKKCRPLWRESHFEVKSKKLRGTEHFWTFRCRISFNYNHHYTTLTTLHSTTTTLQLQLQLQLQLNWTTLQVQLQLPLPLQLQLQLQLRYNYNYYYDYNYAASHYTTLH